MTTTGFGRSTAKVSFTNWFLNEWGRGVECGHSVSVSADDAARIQPLAPPNLWHFPYCGLTSSPEHR